MVSFYAAAVGVMFLLFTASGAAGSLLDEAESGTLDRVLSSRVTVTTLPAGKLAYSTLLAFSQLVWRDEPVSHLRPQVLVLLTVGAVPSVIARKLAERWEYA